MSDVWRELVERLKQKAKFAQDICHAISETWRSWELREKLEMEEWVRLEDVKEAIQQLKQNYVLIPRKKKCNDSEIFGSCRGKTHNYAYGAVLCKYYVNGFCKHPNSKYGKSC